MFLKNKEINLIPYLLKVLITVIFTFFISYIYYLFHKENITFDIKYFYIYFIVIFIIYSIYRLYYLLFGYKIITFTPISLLAFFFFHLFILCVFFFFISGKDMSGVFSLFIKILNYLILPFIIMLTSLSFGKKMISIFTEINNNYNKVFNFIINLGLGFFSFSFFINIGGFFGNYNLVAILVIIIGFILFSWKEFLYYIKGIFTYKIKYKINKGNYLYLVSSEFLFWIASLLIGINFISIIRPFPIGWDDLGVYMNMPSLLAHSGTLLGFSGMYTWQALTGIGFLFDSTTQAFFLNNIGGVMSFIILVLIFGDLLKPKNKEYTFINIPLLLSTIFISMPMVIFQQAKDMKLDIGLFFVSIIPIYLLFKLFLKEYKENLFDKLFNKNENQLKNINKDTLKIIFIIGLLLGFAFSIKVTSLLLILGIVGIIIYNNIGLLGFLGYLSIFLGIFTKFGLWRYMNVVYPSDNTVLINTFSFFSIIFGFFIYIFLFIKNKFYCQRSILSIIVLLLGIVLSLSPWFIKNIVSSGGISSISSILGGKVNDKFKIDYSILYSDKELTSKKESSYGRGNSSLGTTTNEDFGRYFGYEKGINNYIKLPWNLTMQLNQKGEFTDITYLFLALIPVLLLFLPFKNKYYSFLILFILLCEIFLFYFEPTKTSLTNYFSTINLPFGYIFIFLIFLIPLLYFNYFLLKTKKNKLFLYNLVFCSLYVFLWNISSFGIVWYGIVMYFSFLLIIGLGLYHMTVYKETETEKEKYSKLFSSIIILFIISIYFIKSTFVHSFFNLKQAGYTKYKIGVLTEEEAVFHYHSDYIKILGQLNIDSNKEKEFLLEKVSNKEVKKLIIENNLDINNAILIINYLINKYSGIKNELINNSLIDTNIKQEIERIDSILVNLKHDRFKIYKGIIKPEKEYINKGVVYRIGTFIKYFISENNKRLFEDSLLMNFDNYMYNKDINKTVDNMKKLGFKYLLVDLNAATIDKDPRHELTKRYERLLSTFRSDKLKLIESDSICLKVALDVYNKSKKEKNDYLQYINIAGINYESYTKDGKIIPRGNKLYVCYNYIYNLIKDNKIDNNNYNYLLLLKQYIDRNGIKNERDIYNLLQKFYSRSYKALFEIK